MKEKMVKVSVPETRQDYLKMFKEINNIKAFYGNDNDDEHIKNVGSNLLKCIKKEDLTYTEAYACLQYCYNKLQFESNFVKILRDDK